MRKTPARFALALAALSFAPSLASAATYGDVVVTVKSDPRGNATHGYAAIEFVVVNKSAQSAHEVRLTYPKSSYGYGGDYLRAATRTVTVESGASVRVSLLYPERLQRSGSGVGVAVARRDQDEPISAGSSSSSRGYGYSSYGSSYGSGTQALVLYSKRVDTRFPDWVSQAAMQLQSRGKYAAAEPVRAEQDAEQWGTDWLGYSRYDGIAVTAEDLRRMPAEVRNAVGQYVECGGSLLVFGQDPPLPGPWKLKPDERLPFSTGGPGFGHCVVTNQLEFGELPVNVVSPALESWA